VACQLAAGWTPAPKPTREKNAPAQRVKAPKAPKPKAPTKAELAALLADALAQLAARK
jgi:hypothetical protein